MNRRSRQGVHRPGLAGDVVDGLGGVGQVGDFDEVIGVLAVPDDGLHAVAPHGQRRALGVGVGTELLLAILLFALFDLDDDVGGVGMVGIHHHDVGALGTVTAEGDGVFHRQAGDRIFVFAGEPVQPELAYHFLALGLHIFVADQAEDITLAVALCEVPFHSGDGSETKEIDERIVLEVIKDLGDVFTAQNIFWLNYRDFSHAASA